MSQQTNTLQPKSISRIAIYGAGIAAKQAALALNEALNFEVELVLIMPQQPCLSDVLYGGVASTESYNMNLNMGLSEPELFLQTNTCFSFGSYYSDWGPAKKNWLQCHHLPFPKDNAVDFHHLMTRHNVKLTDYLISAVAAREGKFAHPPVENPASPLSRAEYGYYFNHQEVNLLLSSKLQSSKIRVVEARLNEVVLNDTCIDKLVLDSGEIISADLYIDGSGVDGELISQLSQKKTILRSVKVNYSEQNKQAPNITCRKVTPVNDGWQAVTPLRDKVNILSLMSCDTEFATNENGAFIEDSQGIHCNKVDLGYRPFAWLGNCVSLGHAACTIEPLSPAPMKLLSSDLSRLLELIPVDTNMALERQEYNRRFINDVIHAELFNKAFYDFRISINDDDESMATISQLLTPFWQYGMNKSPLLDRKIIQFLHRGKLVSYDLEPFNQEDWTILHSGIGRLPDKYDRLAEIIDSKKMIAKLDKMKAGLAHFVSKMPPHQLYITKLLQYLKDKT